MPHPPPTSAPLDLERYVPALLTWISNKLSRGASTLYLKHYDVGIEVWRCLVLLAHGQPLSAQQISQKIGLDKASVSRCFKRMHSDGLIELGLDKNDGRLRMATITTKGLDTHNRIRDLALTREKALLGSLAPNEVDTLLALLHRLHANLPDVERASSEYLNSQANKTHE